MEALVGAFKQEMGLEGAFSVIVKTDGWFAALISILFLLFLLLPLRSPVHVFAYRTHAHNLGSVISAYRYVARDTWLMGVIVG